MFRATKSASDSQKEVELPTFIDMVFLLLVFFIVSLSLSPDTDIPVPPSTIELPKVKGTASIIEGGQLSTLTLQIEKSAPDVPNAPKALYVLWPSSSAKAITEQQALQKIKDALVAEIPDSTNFAVFPEGFLGLSKAEIDREKAFRLIAESIERYRNENFNTASISNTIEVIADVETEFKIINYILQQCSRYEDKIPRVTFRVKPPGEPQGGTDIGN